MMKKAFQPGLKTFLTGWLILSCLVTAWAQGTRSSALRGTTPRYVDAAYQEQEPPAEDTQETQPMPDEPPAPPPQRTTPQLDLRRSAPRSGSPPANLLAARLNRSPPMFGDLQAGMGQLFIFDRQVSDNQMLIDLPALGGARRLKIAENNRPIPEDRVFFVYNHFHNALTSVSDNPGIPRQSAPVDRYLPGFEKTWDDRNASVEVRLPFTGTYFLDPTVTGGFGVETGGVGNLSVILKRLLYASDTWAFGAGLGIETPTGDNLTGEVVPTFSFEIQNDAVHLMPFIGATWSPNDLFFSHSFVQVDVATGGNEVFMTDPAMGPGPVSIGKHTPANLLLVDVGGGVWLFRNPSAPYIRGMALITEIHYTTTLQDADLVNSDDTFPSPNGQVVIFDPQNRRDFLNLTVGLHTDIGPLTSIRVGTVLPLREGPDQPFDAEVHVSVNRLY